MIVNGLKRDFTSNQGDEMGVILDTLNDHRSGFFFSTNPAGARRDLQSSNDSTINQQWDGVWDVRVQVEEDRWVAEFRVPFKTLRFSSSESLEWGLNMYRKIKRANEESHWAPLPRRYNMTRVSLAGSLKGLEGVRQGRNLKVKPYGKAGLTQVRSGSGLDADSEFDGGFDAKYGLTQSLTLDVSYRTDFSEVEVDQDQVNLTRFNLFFPEKREFFLENSGVFAFGSRRASTSGRGGGEQLLHRRDHHESRFVDLGRPQPGLRRRRCLPVLQPAGHLRIHPPERHTGTGGSEPGPQVRRRVERRRSVFRCRLREGRRRLQPGDGFHPSRRQFTLFG